MSEYCEKKERKKKNPLWFYKLLNQLPHESGPCTRSRMLYCSSVCTPVPWWTCKAGTLAHSGQQSPHLRYITSKHTRTKHTLASSHYAECELRLDLVGWRQTTCLLWIWMKLCMSQSLWHDSFIRIMQSNTHTQASPLCYYHHSLD